MVNWKNSEQICWIFLLLPTYWLRCGQTEQNRIPLSQPLKDWKHTRNLTFFTSICPWRAKDSLEKFAEKNGFQKYFGRWLLTRTKMKGLKKNNSLEDQELAREAEIAFRKEEEITDKKL